MQHKRNNILLLDDDEDIRELLSTILKMKGYSVTAVANINFNSLNEIPDLIMLDVLLSGKDGRNICTYLKNHSLTSDIPVIMFSGLSDAKEECLQAGADAFILKPFNVSALSNEINFLLQKTEVLESV